MHYLFAAVLALFLIAPAGAAPDPRVADILARNKAATGGAAWDSTAFVRTKMRMETSGLKGTAESFEDARTGAYADSYDLGAFKGASGYDGKTVWEQDASGEVVIQGAENQRHAAVNEAYRRSHAYWYGDRAQARIEYAGETPDGARKLHVLRILPDGGRPFDMWIDAKTFLVDRIAERNARELRTTFFSDYRSVDGKLIAHAARQTNGETKYDAFLKVESVAFEADAPRTAFAPPPPPKRDFGFLRGSSTTIPFRLVNNHIYMEVRLNGRAYDFLFDTGGLNVITPTVARELGLSAEGAIQATGAGEDSKEAGFTKVARMQVGDAFLDNQTFVVIGLEAFKEVEGKPITGIIGYEVFKRFVVRLDYENSKVVLIEPSNFAYRGPGVRVPMDMNERMPEVQGEIDGIPGKFALDTGSRSTLDLMSPFVAKHNLVQRYGAKYQGVTGWGVGGPSRSWVVRGKRLSLGGVSVDAPIVELSQAKGGSFNDAYQAGNVGGGVLKKFNIVWNYPRHEIFFEKNKLYDTPDVFDRAGFWVNLGDGAFDVVDVITHSPAEAAGLKQGDRIVGVNGKRAVTDISLPDLRLLKKAPPGTNLILEVLRGGQRLTINILLKDMV
ncbi:MAG: aspartyl protease family protein [Alphaproteobacteria bacterium]|nr:aspartyl protease family protein [Alphaproteobacteria bacterium]